MRTHYAPLFAKLMLLSLVMILPMACSLLTNEDKNPTPIPTQPILPTPLIVTATPFATTQPQATAMPTNAPIPTSAPRVTAAPCNIPVGWGPYYVASGDTLNAIARRAGTTAAQIATGNCLPDANTIYVGQLLYTPPMIVPTATSAPLACTLVPRLVAGGQGRVTPGLPNVVRSNPGTGSNSVELGQIPASGVFTVVTGPQCVGGIYWWQVNYNGLVGWTGEGQGSTYWLEPYATVTCSPAPRLVAGGQGRVLAGSPNAVRSAPGTGSNSLVTGQIPGSGVFSVISGPQCANGIYWWQVNYNGLIGWTGEGQNGAYWVEPYNAVTCSPYPRLAIGQQARITPGLPNTLRSSPSFNGAALGQIPGSGVVSVLGGPQCAEGSYWWQVNYNGAIGWTPEGQSGTYWIEPYSPSACTLMPGLLIGYSGHVLPGASNALRSQPGTSGGSAVIGQIPAGAAFRVLSGPQCADGYYWWQVNYAGQIGWTAEGQGTTYWVEPLTCPYAMMSRLMTNIQARVTPGTPNRLRLQPDSNAAVIGEIPGGGAFTIVGGPQCGSEGWVWWQVNYGGQVGWTAEGDNTAYWLEPLQ